jgi:uncharacterized membrane protein YeaQ/YmgE (transglycosylase-associated protein family)
MSLEQVGNRVKRETSPFPYRQSSNHRRTAELEVYPRMGLIVFILVGALAGFLAGKVMTGHGLGVIWDIVVGILGAFLGGWLAGLVGIAVTNLVVEIIVAFIGACILLFLFRLVRRRRMVRT